MDYVERIPQTALVSYLEIASIQVRCAESRSGSTVTDSL
jgi:hypothetical protein